MAIAVQQGTSRRWLGGLIACLLALALVAAIGLVTRAGDASANDVQGDLDKNYTVVIDGDSDAGFDCLVAVKAAGGEIRAVKSDAGEVLYETPAPTYRGGSPDRLWDDAISTPLAAWYDATISAGSTLTELQVAICLEPEVGYSMANALAGFVVDGNINDEKIHLDFAALNDWLAPYKGDAGQIKGWTDDTLQMSGSDISADLDKWADYQKLAERLNTLLGRFTNPTIGAPVSTKNWHLILADNFTVGDGVAGVELNPNQEGEKALVFAINLKGQTGCVMSLGANLGDKRPEYFGCQPVCPEGTDKAGQLIPEGMDESWCTNPVAPDQPVTPDTPGTDKPKPTPTPTTPDRPKPTPTPTPTPSNSPKSSDKKDYPGSDTAPTGDTGGKPADTTPAPVPDPVKPEVKPTDPATGPAPTTRPTDAHPDAPTVEPSPSTNPSGDPSAP